MPLACPSLSPDSSGNSTITHLHPLPPIIPGDIFGGKTTQEEYGTTLCIVAYEMIRQQNKKRVDMIEIGIRLWNGFIKGDGDGGCKVQNKLLFSVLEYISGGDCRSAEDLM